MKLGARKFAKAIAAALPGAVLTWAGCDRTPAPTPAPPPPAAAPQPSVAENIAAGKAYLLEGDVDKALEKFSRALAQEPRNGEAASQRADVWSRKGEYRRAEDDLTLALAEKPDEA